MTEINLYKRGQGDVALSASEGQVRYTHCWADSWRTGESRAAGHSHIMSVLGLCHLGLGYIEVLML